MDTATFTSTFSEERRPIHLFLRELKFGEKMLPTDLYLDMWGELRVKGRVRFWKNKYTRGYAKHYRICDFASSDFMMEKKKG